MRSITRWRSQPTTGAATKASARVGVRLTSVQRAISLSDAEWRALVTLHSNLLLEGHLPATDHFLRALHPHLVGPILCWRAATQLSLPRDHRGSLLLFGVTGMSKDAQGHVFEWLTHVQERVQVVSTTTQPLFASVERGEFRADLYYRLSVLRIRAVSVA